MTSKIYVIGMVQVLGDAILSTYLYISNMFMYWLKVGEIISPVSTCLSCAKKPPVQGPCPFNHIVTLLHHSFSCNDNATSTQVFWKHTRRDATSNSVEYLEVSLGAYIFTLSWPERGVYMKNNGGNLRFYYSHRETSQGSINIYFKLWSERGVGILLCGGILR